MNQIAIEMFCTVGVAVLCIVLGIIALTIFFIVLGRFQKSDSNIEPLVFEEIFNENAWAKVYVPGAEPLERVQYVGLVTSGDLAMNFAYEHIVMVLFRDELGCQFLVRAKPVKLIAIEPQEIDEN